MTDYQYDFISPEPLYAEIREELGSYFATGVIDDLMFPIYTNKALNKLSRASLPIRNIMLFLDNYTAILPSGFKKVRELWVCTDVASKSIRTGGSEYVVTSTLMNHNVDRCT